MKEKIIRVLQYPNVVTFHYDDRSWDVGDVDDGLWKLKHRSTCISRIGSLKSFLEMPYIEDVFGKCDKARSVWTLELAAADRGFVYADLRDVNVFRINRLSTVLSTQAILIDGYDGSCVGSLKRYNMACNYLLPRQNEVGKDCEVSREEYNIMGFEEKKSYVYKVKVNVFGFLSCLANESRQLR